MLLDPSRLRPDIGTQSPIDVLLRPAHQLTRSRSTHFDLRYEESNRTMWSSVLQGSSQGRATASLLSDHSQMQHDVRALHAAQCLEGLEPIRYLVSQSRIPGIYNLGGDIVLFADRIRAGDRAAMHDYAHQCIDVIYGNYVAFDIPIITIALIQGDALGGGFEDALSHDVLIAERNARMGLPEILFNLFPGMGAYSFLSRRIGAAHAEALILSGNLHTGAELHAIGVVDVLAEDGQGELTALDYIERNARKFNAQLAMRHTRRAAGGVTEQELRGVVDIWVDAAMRVTEPDLRKMEKLAQAQRRRLQSVH